MIAKRHDDRQDLRLSHNSPDQVEMSPMDAIEHAECDTTTFATQRPVSVVPVDNDHRRLPSSEKTTR
jgi:hypothetical protein